MLKHITGIHTNWQEQRIEVITFKPHQALDYIKPYIPENAIIVEAGAFDGHETLRIAKQWPKATIHAFEPVPEIFKRLSANTQHLSTVHRYQLALSDSTGTAPLYLSEKPEKPGIASQANSLLKPKERLKHSSIIFPSTLEVTTTTLDAWARQNTIDHIDLLWLDLQGYELNVLKSSPKVLSTVKVIFTEVEFIQAYEGQYQYPDVRQWLEAQEFTMIGKDFPDDPTWFFGNALFVRK